MKHARFYPPPDYKPATMLVCVKDAGLRPRRFAAPAGSLTQPVRGGLAEVSGRGMSFWCCALPLAGRTGNGYWWALAFASSA
jgi:hypothetical protein